MARAVRSESFLRKTEEELPHSPVVSPTTGANRTPARHGMVSPKVLTILLLLTVSCNCAAILGKIRQQLKRAHYRGVHGHVDLPSRSKPALRKSPGNTFDHLDKRPFRLSGLSRILCLEHDICAVWDHTAAECMAFSINTCAFAVPDTRAVDWFVKPPLLFAVNRLPQFNLFVGVQDTAVTEETFFSFCIFFFV